MNTIEGRAEDACADAGAAGCREHPASGRKSNKAASLYMRDSRERIVSPSGKKYTRTAQGTRLRYHDIGEKLGNKGPRGRKITQRQAEQFNSWPICWSRPCAVVTQ
jgi:hypothetical protein